MKFGAYIDNMDIGSANLSILFSFSSYAAINDYITLHNLSMLLTYIVTLYHLKTASDCATMDVVSFLMQFKKPSMFDHSTCSACRFHA